MGYIQTSNVSLSRPVYSNVIHDDMDLLKAAHDVSMTLLESLLSSTVDIATNATIVNAQGKRLVKIYQTSVAGSLCTIIGAVKYVPFTLIAAGSNASTANHLLYDVEPYALTADWNSGYSVGSNITLIWDGARYNEVSRSAV